MKRFLLFIAICLSVAFAYDLNAQTAVGKKDYFASVGQATLSANTLSHYSLNKKSNFFIDLYNETAVPVPMDAVVVKTLVGTNKYKGDKSVFVLDNLFVYSVQESSGWTNYLTFAGSVLDNQSKLTKKQYYLITWKTDEFDTTLPGNADISLKEISPAGKVLSNTHNQSGIEYTRTSMTFKIGAVETVINSISFFPEKTLGKQNAKSVDMIKKFEKSKCNLNETVYSDHYMGVRAF